MCWGSFAIGVVIGAVALMVLICLPGSTDGPL